MADRTPNHRPFTPDQQRQNARFLAALRQTGNVRLACRELGVHRGTYEKRRRASAAFASEWDMVLAAAHAAFQLAGGARMPEAGKGTAAKFRPGTGRGPMRSMGEGPDAQHSESLKTTGGEPVIVRQANGRLQLRRAPPGRMTEAARKQILAAVGETNNLRMAAAGAGFAHTTILARARGDADLARHLAVARRIGRDRVMWQLTDPARRDPARLADLPVPQMTAEEAMFRLHHHRPGGRFQLYRWRVRPLPVPFEQLRPRIIARLNAWQRAEWHRETGKWAYPDEEGEDAERSRS